MVRFIKIDMTMIMIMILHGIDIRPNWLRWDGDISRITSASLQTGKQLSLTNGHPLKVYARLRRDYGDFEILSMGSQRLDTWQT